MKRKIPKGCDMPGAAHRTDGSCRRCDRCERLARPTRWEEGCLASPLSSSRHSVQFGMRNAEAWRLEGLKFERRSRTEMSFYVYCVQSCFLNDHYSSSFHPIGKQMKIEYLRLGSTCLGVASLQKIALPSSLALCSGGARRYQLNSIANGRLHASCKLNL